jgi:hypothetical protein
MHLLAYLQHVGSRHQRASGDQGDPSCRSPAGARQVLLLPVQPPAGSIAALGHPWPPATAPGGSADAALGAGGCGAGQRGTLLLLREALCSACHTLLLPAAGSPIEGLGKLLVGTAMGVLVLNMHCICTMAAVAAWQQAS